MTAVAAQPAAAATQPLGRPWWMTLILGIAAIIIGGLLLFGSLTTQLRTYEMLIVLIGIWWLVDGINDRCRSRRRLYQQRQPVGHS